MLDYIKEGAEKMKKQLDRQEELAKLRILADTISSFVELEKASHHPCTDEEIESIWMIFTSGLRDSEKEDLRPVFDKGVKIYKGEDRW